MALMARHLGYPVAGRHGLRARDRRGRRRGRGRRRRRHRVGRGAVRGRRLDLVPPDPRPGRRAAGADAEAEVRAAAAGAPAAALRARRGRAADDRRDRRDRRRGPRPAVPGSRLGVGHRSPRSASPRRSCCCRCCSSRSPSGVDARSDAAVRTTAALPARGTSSSTGTPSSDSSRPTKSTRLQTAHELDRQLVEQGVAATTDEGGPVRLTTLAATIDRDVFDGESVSDDGGHAAVDRSGCRGPRGLGRGRSRAQAHRPVPHPLTALEWWRGCAGLHRPPSGADPERARACSSAADGARSARAHGSRAGARAADVRSGARRRHRAPLTVDVPASARRFHPSRRRPASSGAGPRGIRLARPVPVERTSWLRGAADGADRGRSRPRRRRGAHADARPGLGRRPGALGLQDPRRHRRPYGRGDGHRPALDQRCSSAATLRRDRRVGAGRARPRSPPGRRCTSASSACAWTGSRSTRCNLRWCACHDFCFGAAAGLRSEAIPVAESVVG